MTNALRHARRGDFWGGAAYRFAIRPPWGAAIGCADTPRDGAGLSPAAIRPAGGACHDTSLHGARLSALPIRRAMGRTYRLRRYGPPILAPWVTPFGLTHGGCPASLQGAVASLTIVVYYVKQGDIRINTVTAIITIRV